MLSSSDYIKAVTYEPIYLVIIKAQKYFNKAGKVPQWHLPLSLRLEFDHWDLLARRDPTPTSLSYDLDMHTRVHMHTVFFISGSLSLLIFLIQS